MRPRPHGGDPQDSRSARRPWAAVAAVALLGAPVAASSDAGLVIHVEGPRGRPPAEAVVYALPPVPQRAAPGRQAVMDQRDRTFVPHVLPVQTGTAVRFPNSDDVQHQVYSFSPAKRFQLPLYEGTPAEPIVFDQPGVVSLGCNIHDKMSAFIVVVDTPYFALVREGNATLELPAGAYEVGLWMPGRHGDLPRERVTLAAGDRKELRLRLAR